jgi:Mce-associated membrane protein
MADDAAVDGPIETSQLADAPPPNGPMSVFRMALTAGLIGIVVLAVLTGWLGFRAYEDRRADAQRNLFVQTARQGAVNLTTIDYEHTDADVRRILESATGSFRDNFAQRWRPFIDLLKRERSKLVGTVRDVGLESQTDDAGQVLVAVTVKPSNPEHAHLEPQVWLMRITVRKVGEQGKIANVAFVS